MSAEYGLVADHSFVYTLHREMIPLTQSVLQGAAQMRFSVNDNQTFEVLEAYTRKNDGQQPTVNVSDIFSQDGAAGPLLSYVDLKIRQIPFKNVAVGDTVVATVRYTERRRYLGDGFSEIFAITPSGADVTSEVTVVGRLRCRLPRLQNNSTIKRPSPTTRSCITGVATSKYLSPQNNGNAAGGQKVRTLPH